MLKPEFCPVFSHTVLDMLESGREKDLNPVSACVNVFVLCRVGPGAEEGRAGLQ